MKAHWHTITDMSRDRDNRLVDRSLSAIKTLHLESPNSLPRRSRTAIRMVQTKHFFGNSKIKSICQDLILGWGVVDYRGLVTLDPSHPIRLSSLTNH